jgi:hypothetical protein
MYVAIDYLYENFDYSVNITTPEIKHCAKATRTKASLLPVQRGAVAPSAPIRIALPNGLRIEVPSALSVDEWRPLLTLLSSSAWSARTMMARWCICAWSLLIGVNKSTALLLWCETRCR